MDGNGAGGNCARQSDLERWLLTSTSLHRRGTEKRIGKLYALRMWIGEIFRDLKGKHLVSAAMPAHTARVAR